MADALVRLLNSVGYQPVRLPRTNMQPPDVYTFDRRRLVRWGPLNDFLQDDVTLERSTGELPDIEHKHTSGKSLSSAVSFLEDALRCIGLDTVPKLDLSFGGSTQLAFSFSELTYVATEPSKLAPALERFSPRHIPEEFAVGGKIHLAYEYAFAKRILMQRADQRKFENVVSGDIGEYVKLGAEGKVEVVDETTVSFSSSSDRSAAFAYKSGRLMQRNSSWEFFPMESTMEEGKRKEKAYIPMRGIVLAADESE